MADAKISALPASTTPLAGTEVVPIVQSGVTKQVSVANLTAGRAVAAASIAATQATLGSVEVVYGGKGDNVDFSRSPVYVLENTTTTGGINHRCGFLYKSYNSSNVQTTCEVRWEAGAGLAWYINSSEVMRINGNGVLMPEQAPTASAPAYVKGGIYFDTTLNKLRIGGATGWETVTST